MNASTSLMVPVEHLTRIQGFNQMLSGGLNIISAPLGALLLGLLSMQGILSIDVITALFAILPMTFIQIPQPERNAVVAEKTTVWTDFKAGLRYMLSWPGLLIIGLMTVGIILAWFYANTKGGTFAALLGHTMFNWSNWVFPALKSDSASLILFGLYFLAVIYIIWKYGRKTLTK